MSMWLLIDGYNVVAPVAAPGRIPDPNWLHRERMRLLDRLADHIDPNTRRRTCVVFDAANPPPGRPSRFEHASIDVRFAVDHAEADDLIEELIAAHSAPKRLTVVSSDRRIRDAASRRGATPWEAQPWLDELLDGRLRLGAKIRRASRGRSGERTGKVGGAAQGGAGQGGEAGGTGHDAKPDLDLTPEELQDWMKTFGFDPPER